MINSTASGFILLAAGLSFCGFWFLRPYKKSNGSGRVGFLLTIIFLGYGIQNGWMGLGMWIFAHNSEGLFVTLLVDNILLTITAAFCVYTSYYIFSPHVSPWRSIMLTVLLGTIATITTVISHPLPYLTAHNSIELNTGKGLGFLIFYLLFINIGSSIYIFGKLFKNSASRAVKNLSLLQCFLAVLGIANVFISLVLKHFKAGAAPPVLFDYTSATIGITFIIALVIIPLWKKWLASRY